MPLTQKKCFPRLGLRYLPLSLTITRGNGGKKSRKKEKIGKIRFFKWGYLRSLFKRVKSIFSQSFSILHSIITLHSPSAVSQTSWKKTWTKLLAEKIFQSSQMRKMGKVWEKSPRFFFFWSTLCLPRDMCHHTTNIPFVYFPTPYELFYQTLSITFNIACNYKSLWS